MQLILGEGMHYGFMDIVLNPVKQGIRSADMMNRHAIALPMLLNESMTRLNTLWRII